MTYERPDPITGFDENSQSLSFVYTDIGSFAVDEVFLHRKRILPSSNRTCVR
eukprot:TRINITY_DN7970_c0_g1_i1.p2 TRINITY_DN7970_c0_g1~~TRINITY_DN7970_c0_g1_i1.p2  ORF type:complete len:52 (-),score=3.76 TRINITY_DN7970_c0_g1_i1:202-357(-)